MPKKCILRTPDHGIPIETLRAELSKCSDPDRIKELRKIIDEFDFGITES